MLAQDAMRVAKRAEHGTTADDRLTLVGVIVEEAYGLGAPVSASHEVTQDEDAGVVRTDEQDATMKGDVATARRLLRRVREAERQTRTTLERDDEQVFQSRHRERRSHQMQGV